MKKLIKRIIFLVFFMLISIKLVRFIVINRTPVKYAINLEDIQNYPNSIIVKETWHTGTGWEKIGDKNGLYTDSKKIFDVKLEGNLPFGAKIGGENINIFLCIVEPIGKFRIQGTTSPIYLYDKFKVVDWYPIYPVKRETLLPSWFYPSKYLSKADFEKELL